MKYIIIGITLLIISYMVAINYMQLNYPNHFGHFTGMMDEN